MENSQCKICRRAGAKLFLKGERCITPKCAMVTKPYTPGALGKSGGKRKGRRGSSEYGTQLRDKQVVKFSYGLRERQFVNYVKEASKKKGVASLELVKLLESRLDNVVYRLGFTSNRASSRQLVSHGHITINGRRNNIPSYRVKTGDLIGIRGGSVGKDHLKDWLTDGRNLNRLHGLLLIRKRRKRLLPEMPYQMILDLILIPLLNFIHVNFL